MSLLKQCVWAGFFISVYVNYFTSTVSKVYFMEDKVLKFIRDNQLIQPGTSLLIGVSGGADSMALLYLMCQYRDVLACKIAVAHLHHDMRGQSADEDADYVKGFCDNHSIPFFFKKVDVITLAKREKMTVEEAGRKARYDFFDEVMKKENYALLATAHHMNDQAETLLIRLLRGTGLKGAMGIPVKQGKVIRPLLCVTRSEIENYCEAHNLEMRHDITNDDDNLTRNKIRHQVLPVLNTVNASSVKHFSDFSECVKEAQSFLDLQISETEKNLFGHDLNYCLIEALVRLHPYLQKQMLRCGIKNAGATLKDVEKRHLNMILTKLKESATVWSLNLTNQVIVRREYDRLFFEKKEAEHADVFCYQIPVDHSDSYHFRNMQVKVEVLLSNSIKNEEYCKKDCSIFLSCDTISISVCLRNRKAGDVMMLPGTEGHKKVKKLLIDRKIPKQQRDKLPLLAVENHVLLIPHIAKDKHVIKPDLSKEKTIKITLEMTHESGH